MPEPDALDLLDELLETPAESPQHPRRRRRWWRSRPEEPEEPAPDLLDDLLEGPSERRRRWWRWTRRPRADTPEESISEEEPAAAAGATTQEDTDEPDVPGAVEPGGPGGDGRAEVVLTPQGPRRSALQRRRSRQRKWLGGAVVVAVAAVAIANSDPLQRRDQDESAVGTAPSIGADTDTALLYGTVSKPGRSAPHVVWMTLLSINPSTGQGAVIYVPAHSAAEVPGRGLMGLGGSLASGGPRLLEVSAESLLGLSIDEQLELGAGPARALFENIGEITVDVPGEVRVPAGEDQARVLFTPGPQRLGPEFLVPLMYELGVDGDDAELSGRNLAFWNGLFERYADDPGALGEAVEGVRTDQGSKDRVAALLARLAALPQSQRTMAALPARQVSVGGHELYQVDEDEAGALIEDAVGVLPSGEDAVAVQVLNGNGVPGIGEKVAGELVGEGFRVVLSGNADRLDYYWTRIVSYESSTAGVAAARRVRSLLGVGRVQVSPQGQGIVDLTIVVGRDFLRNR